jgi:hypothetical protein|nr:MAG TPA: hypothetical protein [Caudoviricetes sp.]
MSKLMEDVENNIKRFQDIISGHKAPLNEDEVKKVTEVNKALRIAIATVREPLTTQAMVESLLTFNKVKAEFRLAFDSMFDNLLKDPLLYFFGKYNGIIVVNVDNTDVKLNFQFERKLYTICYKEIPGISNIDSYNLFLRSLNIVNKVRKELLVEILRIVYSDVKTQLDIVEVFNLNTSKQVQFYNDLYNKLNAYQVLSSDTETSLLPTDIVIARSKVITSNINRYIDEILKEQLKKAKYEIATMFYNEILDTSKSKQRYPLPIKECMAYLCI